MLKAMNDMMRPPGTPTKNELIGPFIAFQPPALVGHYAVFALRAKFALALRHYKGLVEGRARLFGKDYAIDESALRRAIRVGEGFFVFLYLFGALGGLVFGGFNFLAEDDVRRAFSSHDGYLGLRPRKHDVGAEVFAAHAEVGSAVGLAQ